MQWTVEPQPEIREFLGGKPMIPYDEKWMPHASTP